MKEQRSEADSAPKRSRMRHPAGGLEGRAKQPGAATGASSLSGPSGLYTDRPGDVV